MARDGVDTDADEEALLARCRAGDQHAFRILLEAHHQQVYRTAYALVADVDEAADLTQETFLKAWRALPRFRGDATVGTWLTRLALNTARDHLRRRRGHTMLALLRGAGPQVADDPAAAAADRDELRRALGQLSAQAREVVALRFGRDLPLAEIAALLDCPEGTVKSRLHGALTRLGALLRRERATVTGEQPVGGTDERPR